MATELPPLLASPRAGEEIESFPLLLEEGLGLPAIGHEPQAMAGGGGVPYCQNHKLCMIRGVAQDLSKTRPRGRIFVFDVL